MTGEVPPVGPSPEALLRRFRDFGDPEALGALFDATSPALFRMALRLAPDPGAAEDALQETFLALFDAARGYDPTKPALAWLAGILRHRVQRTHRERARRPDFTRLPPPLAQAGPAEEAGAAERAERVRKAILDLDEPYRSVALLRWRYGLEPAEIAEVRGEPPGTVWSTLSRAKEMLREALAGSPSLLGVLALPPGEGPGLAAMRRLLVERAGTAVSVPTGGAAAAAGSAAGGFLVTKKVAAAAALLLALLATWFTVRAGDPRITGVVVDAASGEPIPGARISGFGGDGLSAGADGTFALDPGAGKVIPLRADAGGFAGVSRTVRSGERVAFALDRGNTVRGRVLAEDGTPVAGAEVLVEDRNRDPRERRSARTGPDGSFTCTGVGREGIRVAFVLADGHGRLVKDFAADGGSPRDVDLGDLVLPAARRLEGLFLSGSGRPLAGATLSLLGPLEQERACRLPGMFLNATTDGEGRFRFAGLGPGRYRLSHHDSGAGLPRWPSASVEVTLPPDRDLLDADLRLEGTGTLGVRVVDAAGAPLPGVLVATDGGILAETDGSGLAVLENLRAGGKVAVHLELFGARKQEWVEVDGPEGDVPADGREVRIVAARAGVVEGVVLDGDGEPAGRAAVSFTGGNEVDGPLWKGKYGALTKDDGTFRLHAAAGAVVDLEARRNPSGGVQAGDELLVGRAAGVRAPAKGIVLRCRTVKATGSVVLRVVDASGLPVAGLDLLARGGGAADRPLRTGTDGRALLDRVFEDESLFWFGFPERAPGAPWPLPSGEAPPLPVRALADGREVILRLRPGAALEGVVEDGEGRPVAGAAVLCPTDRVRTGADGRFSLVVAEGEKVRFLLARAGEVGKEERAALEDVDPAAGPVRMVLGRE